MPVDDGEEGDQYARRRDQGLSPTEVQAAGSPIPEHFLSCVEAVHERYRAVTRMLPRFAVADQRQHTVGLADVLEQDPQLALERPEGRGHHQLDVADDGGRTVPPDPGVGDVGAVHRSREAAPSPEHAAVGHQVGDLSHEIAREDDRRERRRAEEGGERDDAIHSGELGDGEQRREACRHDR